MKRNLMIIGCLSIFFACNGGEEKNNTITSEFSGTSTEQNLENVDTKKLQESVEDSSEEKGKYNEKQVHESNDVEDRQEAINVEGSVKDSKQGNTNEVKNEPAEIATAPTNTVEQEKKQKKANIVLISVVPDLMKFDKEVFTVVAGQEVVIELDNPDGMQHNLVISKPGTLKEVGVAADALARDPKGAQKQYVPEIPAVLFATPLLEPGDVYTLTFTAPTEPGDYPFICTFPGHWRMMNGIMKVTK